MQLKPLLCLIVILASHPVSAAVFGNNETVAGSWLLSPDYIFCFNDTPPASGTVNNVTAYIFKNSANVNVTFAYYSGNTTNPQSLIVTSEELLVTNGAGAWQTVALTSSESTDTVNTAWLCAIGDDDFEVGKVVDDSGLWYVAEPYPTYPAEMPPGDGTLGTGEWAQYFTYTEGVDQCVYDTGDWLINDGSECSPDSTTTTGNIRVSGGSRLTASGGVTIKST